MMIVMVMMTTTMSTVDDNDDMIMTVLQLVYRLVKTPAAEDGQLLPGETTWS